MSDSRPELPPGWVRTTLGEATKWSSGGTPRSTEAAYYGGSIPWAVIGDLNEGIVRETTTQITEQGLTESSAKWVSEGSVLIAMYGSIGKLGIAGTRLTTNQAIAFCDPTPIEPKYLFWYLMGQRRNLLHAGKGGTQSNISQTVLKAFPFELAPLAEQRRIVAAIEEHLSLVDATVAGLQRVKSLMPRYRSSVLTAACRGRLVETEASLALKRGYSFESGRELLVRLIKNGRPFFESGAPEGWAIAPLRDVAELKGGLTKGQKRRVATSLRHVPYLRVANVQRGYLDLSEIKEIEATDAEIADLALKSGDVLFNEGGDRDKLGRGWVWNGEIPICVHQNHVFRARPIPGVIDPRLLSWYGNSIGQKFFNDEGKQTTNLASINLTKLGSLPVPIPPVAEQTRVVAEVERRLSVADALAKTIDDNLSRAHRLRQSILKRAFEGKLVPQDPRDEPASVLLERIRTSRPAPSSKPKNSRRSA